jgi:DNA-binding NarL/FixJ family response regulator
MRVVLVGSAFERERLRGQLQTAALDVVGEFNSLAAAQAAGLDADAIVLAHEMGSTSVNTDGFDEPAEPLTSREVQVLELLAEGLSNKSIAERLGISDQTVKFHVASISGKLGAVNRTDAVRRAVRRGLIAL